MSKALVNASICREVEKTKPVVCPYCGRFSELVSGERIYPHRKDLYRLMFWLCEPCSAYVGCHKPNKRLGFDGTEPMGRLANYHLRCAKSDAHKAFDWVWREGYMRRTTAYSWLAEKLCISKDECHIGEFDLARCSQVEAICKELRRRFK